MDDELRAAKLRKLEAGDCPLVPGGELARRAMAGLFNRVLTLHELVQAAMPEAMQFRVAELDKELRAVQARLTRRRYHVGFIGPFQVGKSSTFNGVLKDSVASPGRSEAMTAAVTRMRPIAQGEHGLEIRFLTRPEYLQKREYLCRRTNCDARWSDAKIKQDLQQRRIELRAGTNVTCQAFTDDTVRSMDVDYLDLLLNSFAAHQDKVREPRLEEKAGFHARNLYLNHPPGDWRTSVAFPPLLHDVVVNLRTEVVPETLEMIDLPGLGSGSSVDRYLTEQFIETLDGALVFCQVTQVGPGDVDRILAQLRHVWHGRMKGKVWLVFTYCDSLSPEHIPQIGEEGSPASGSVKPTMFEAVRKFMDLQGIPGHQVFFVTNVPFAWKPDEEAIVKRLSGEGMAGIRDAWAQLFRNGGIDSLRTLIAEQLAEHVGNSVCEQSREDLERLGYDLRHLASGIVTSPACDGDLIDLSDRASNRCCRLLAHLACGPLWLDGVSLSLQHALDETFDRMEVDPDAWDGSGLEENKTAFQQHTLNLERRLRTEMRLTATAAGYEQLLSHLQDLERQRPLEIPGILPRGLQAAWESYRQEDETTEDWLCDGFPSFLRFSPYDDLPAGASRLLSGQEYSELMREKIRVVSQQAVRALRNRLRQRLTTIVASLRAFSRPPEQAQALSGPAADLARRLEEFEDFAEFGPRNSHY